jgi:hypothetical protein
MKATIGLVIIIVGVIVTFNVFLPGGNGEPVATPTLPAQAVHVESTATPAPTATPQPISGAPVRVQFDLGSYGETLTSTVSTSYLLWAKAGQTFTTTLSANTTALASLYAPDGVALYQELAAGYTAKATLPTNGDYRLEIRSSGNYTVGVMIK